MTTRLTTHDSTTIISLGGRWVCGDDPRTQLRTNVQRGFDGGQSDIVLDLGGWTFADLVVVGEIAWTHVALRRGQGHLVLQDPSARMRRLLW